MVIYAVFLHDVACQKLLNLVDVSRSYSQNNTGTVFLRHGVYTLNITGDIFVKISKTAICQVFRNRL